LIECDKQSLNSLQKHLKIYKVRRKIEVRDLTGDFDVYALYNIENALETKHAHISNPGKLEGTIVSCTQLNTTLPSGLNTFKMYKDLAIFVDPRIVFLGNRIIAPTNCNIEEQLRELYQFNWSASKLNYQWFRYKLGVGEGINDLPPGNCFPLESNCDYLHGVSFHKGCYIGQELTARTHHTGVVRKRLMPLQFIKIPTGSVEDLKIQRNGKRLGILRGIKDDSGIALLKISEALEMKEIEIGNGLAKTERPFWWPVEAPKEVISQKG
ncbi:putative transferase CAF17 homolog, mitochondrial, partial [Agrilus planipennis]|uniref:Transferase CAF17 homolog, mitochondrial n=1 Tax=Agrilus planipennis TaxID=224129 RepID=A0A1W4XG01_AGRPL